MLVLNLMFTLLQFTSLLTASSVPPHKVKGWTTKSLHEFPSELQFKLFKLIGLELIQENEHLKTGNGYLQIVSQDYGNFISQFVTCTTKEFHLSTFLYSNFESLLESIQNVKQNKRKSISVSRWTTHRASTIVWISDNNDITKVIDGVKRIGGESRRGDMIFLGQESKLITLFDHSVIKSLKYKSGLVTDSHDLLVMTEPMIYNGQMMTSVHIPPRFNMKVNIHQRHIRISGSKMPPYCDVRIGKNGEKIFSGSNYDIIKSASIKYNFTFDLDAPPKKSPGVKLKNGTWIGMLADVVAGKADITIVNAYNVERFHVIDFTSFFTVTNFVYVTSHAKREVSLAAIIYPYDTQVWILIISLFIFIMPIFGISFWFNPYGVNRDWKDVLYKSIFIPIVLSLRQDFHVPHGLNFLHLTWMIFIILIDIGYESNLVSYLSFPEPGTIPTNFVELADHSEYQVKFNIFSNIGRSLFRNGHSRMLKKLNSKFLSESSTPDCVITAFTNEHAACAGWDDILNSVISKNLTLTFGIDPLFMSQHSLVNNWLAFGLRKDSEYTEAFSYIASSYAVTGLVQKWKENVMEFYRNIGRGWMSTQENTSLHSKLIELAAGNQNDPKPFQIANVLISFVVFWCGIFISTIAFAFEVVPHLYKYFKSNTGSYTKLTKWKSNAIKISFLTGKLKSSKDNRILSPGVIMNELYIKTSSNSFDERPKTGPSLKGGQLL